MTPLLIPALAGGLLIAGILLTIAGVRRTAPTVRPAAPARRRSRVLRRLTSASRATKILLVVGLLAGLVVTVVTGWIPALALVPLAVVGLPVLLSSSPAAAQISKLEALEEWTRALASQLTVGVGLEDAIRVTLRSTPEAIRPEVTALVARLRARIPTESALQAFADDLDDATGDLVAAQLKLGARRRGQGLASVLESLAQDVATDVRARRAIEADRAKPRTTARWVTIITVVVLAVLALTGDYVAPYGTPVGEILIVLYLAAYIALLIWLRRMAGGEPLPRFLGQENRELPR